MSPNAILANSFPPLGYGALFAGFFSYGRVLDAHIGQPTETMNTTLSRSSLIAGATFGICFGMLDVLMKISNHAKVVSIIGYSLLTTMAVISCLQLRSSKTVGIASLVGTVIWASKFYFHRSAI